MTIGSDEFIILVMDFDVLSFVAGLNTRFVGRTLYYYPSLPSTMDKVRSLAQDGAGEGAAVVAGEQTAGRGRLGRAWLSPPGNMALSVLLRPTLEKLPSLVMIASVAVAHAIEQATGLKAAIKWPNDILIAGRKVCGILMEGQFQGNAPAYAIVGIGLNISSDTWAFPELLYPATSLRAELGREVSLSDVLRGVLEELESLYLAEASLAFDEWRKRLHSLGRQVQARGLDGVEEGVAEAVDRSGALLLRRADGSLARITAGDLTLS